MATLDDSPSQYPGISWTAWAEIAELNHKDDPGEEEPPSESKQDSDSMKLKRQEMGLYGLCPARDEVFLVVCEKCGQVIKPQALQWHMESRHNHTSPSKGKRSSSSSASSTPTKCTKSSRSSGSRHRNHTNPVVKVERMSSDVVRQKLSKKSALGYDTDRPRPPEKTEISLDSEEVKQLLEITPDNQPPSSSTVSSFVRISNDFCVPSSQSTSSNAVITLDDDSKSRTSVASTQQESIDIKEETITLGNILDNSMPNTTSSGYQEVPFNPMHQVTFDALKDIFEPSSIKQEDSSRASSKVTSPASVQPATPSTPPVSVDNKPQEISLMSDNDHQFIKVEAPQSSYKVEITTTNNNLTTSTLKTLSAASSQSGTSLIVSSGTPSMLSVNTSSSVALTTIAASPVTTATTLVVSCRSTSPATAPLTTTSASLLSAMKTSATAQSSAHMKTKDPRFLPCKDRIYDAEKHCGVWIEESQRHCTRSLTCKTHALSLRRNVAGRSKSFDQLLLDHRAAKEAALKAKQEAVAAAASRTQPMLQSPGSSPATPAPPTTPLATPSHMPAAPNFRPMHANSGMAPACSKLFKQHSMPASKHTSHLYKPSVPPVFPDHGMEGVPLAECLHASTSRVSSDAEEGDEGHSDPHLPDYISHHPRPAAVNGFGGWLHGSGCYKFHRREDLMRSAFAAAVNRHLHPPPHKKLCVESKLNNSGPPVPSMPHPAPPQQVCDPYDFVVSGAVAAAAASEAPPPNTHANAAAIQAANNALALANKAAAKSLAKSPKSPSTNLSALQHRSLKLNSTAMRPGGAAGIVTTSNAKIGALSAGGGTVQPQAPNQSPTNKRKRTGSNASLPTNHHHHHHPQQQQQPQQQQPISIAIPAAGTFTNKITPTANTQGKFANAANLLSRGDLNIVVSDSINSSTTSATGLVNGQLVSIPGVGHHIHLNALAPLDKNNKNKAGIRSYPAGRGGVPTVTALNSTASSLIGGNTAALLEQQRGGGLTLTMVTNNPASTSSSTVGSVSTAVSGSMLPNGILTSAQTLGQLKGFPISINQLQAAQQQAAKQCAARGASNGAGGKAAGITLSGAAGLRGGVPLNALAAAIQLQGSGQARFMPPHLLQQATALAATPIHLQQQQQQQHAKHGKLAAKQQPMQQQQQQPVSLTIVTPASGAVGPHQTLLLQPQPPPQATQPPRDATPTAATPAEPQLLS